MGPAHTYIRSIVVLPDIRDDLYPHSEGLIRMLKDTGCNVRKNLHTFFMSCSKFLNTGIPEVDLWSTSSNSRYKN